MYGDECEALEINMGYCRDEGLEFLHAQRRQFHNV